MTRSRRWSMRFESLETRNLLAANPVIAEFQSVNQSTIVDADGDYSDWIEIRNDDAEPIDLAGWFITNEANQLAKWRFPQATIVQPGAHLLVFASGKDRDGGADLHTNFQLSDDGGYLALIKPDGLTVAQAYADYPTLLADQSYGLAVVPPAVAPGPSLFRAPTPGAINGIPALPTPIVGGTQGLFFESTEVNLFLPDDYADDPSLAIRYTTDGSLPTSTSELYEAPITLTTSTLLRANTFELSQAQNYEPSIPAAATFLAVDNSLRNFSSNLPLLILDGTDAIPDASSRLLTPSSVVLLSPSATTRRTRLDGSASNVEYIGRAGIRDDGEADGTAGQTKPELEFQTWGPAGTSSTDATPTALLGLASDSDWVLHAPLSFDRTLFRNQLGYQLGQNVGVWTPGYRQVEVYLDGGRNAGDGVINEDDYMGVYVLRERVAKGPGRLDLAPSTPATPFDDGGYVWRVHRTNPDDPAFTAGGQIIQWVDPPGPQNRVAPEAERATTAQQQAAVDYFDAFRATLDSPNINDPDGYSNYINPVNWVDNHLLSVMLMNVDALRLHNYFYKDAGGRLNVASLLDLDRSADSNDDRDDHPNMWRAQTGDLGTDYFGTSTQRFWGELFTDPGFWQLYIDRWQSWRESALSDGAIEAIVDSFGTQLSEAAARDISANPASRPRISSGYERNLLDGTYQGEINNLKRWLLDRAAFMDSNFNLPPAVLIDGNQLGAAPGATVQAGAEIELVPANQRIITDQVLIDGTVGATQARYAVIGDDSLRDTWAEPTFDDSQWSVGPLGFGFEPDGRDDFESLIATEVRPEDQFPGSTTMLIRVEFHVEDIDAAMANELVLRTKYDDGFVVYLNGQQVLAHNLRDQQLAWNSRALSHRNSEAMVFAEFELPETSQLLVPGKNTLAIRAINASSTSSDMLMLPELVSRNVRIGRDLAARVYYTTDGRDPRGPDGSPSVSAKLLQGGGLIAIREATALTVRSFHQTDRGRESEIVRSDWSSARQYMIRIGEPVAGDFTGDGQLDTRDIDLLLQQLGAEPVNLRFDLNSDAQVNGQDRDLWVNQIRSTHYGDANLDGVFDSADLVQIFAAGEYLDGFFGNSSWAEGDWNGDGDFTTTDLVLALQGGGFV